MATSAISATATNLLPLGVAIERDELPRADRSRRDDSESGLVRRARCGDEQAFAALYQLHKKRVYAICLKMTKNVADAEDLTQEAFLQVFRCVNSFRGDSAFSTWLYRIAVNTVLMKLRRRKSPPLVSLDDPVSSESPSLKREVGRADPNLSGSIDRLALRRAVADLPAGCRQIFDLHEIEGYQHHEIARLLQCSIGNSKSQLHKAKLKMRDALLPGKGKKIARAANARDVPADVATALSPSAWRNAKLSAI